MLNNENLWEYFWEILMGIRMKTRTTHHKLLLFTWCRSISLKTLNIHYQHYFIVVMSNTEVNLFFTVPSEKLSLCTFSRLTEFDNFSLTSQIYLAKQEQTNYLLLIKKRNFTTSIWKQAKKKLILIKRLIASILLYIPRYWSIIALNVVTLDMHLCMFYKIFRWHCHQLFD